MPPVLTNYSFRYVPNQQRIYLPVQGAVRQFLNATVHTQPFTSRSTHEVRNVLVGYCDKLFLKFHHEGLMDECLLDISLGESKAFASILRMPLVVILKEYHLLEDKTHHFEVYFFHNKEPADADWTMKNLKNKCG